MNVYSKVKVKSQEHYRYFIITFHLFKLAFLSPKPLIYLLHLNLIFNGQRVCLLVSSKHFKDFFFWSLVSTTSHITLPAAFDISCAAAAFKNNTFRPRTWKRTSQINGGEWRRTLMGWGKKWQISVFTPRREKFHMQHFIPLPVNNYLEYLDARLLWAGWGFFFPFFFSFFSSLHLMGLILPLHFAALSWQGSQSSHLLLMPLTGGYLLPYMFSLQLHHGRLRAAKQRGWDADGHLFD